MIKSELIKKYIENFDENKKLEKEILKLAKYKHCQIFVLPTFGPYMITDITFSGEDITYTGIGFRNYTIEKDDMINCTESQLDKDNVEIYDIKTELIEKEKTND